MAKFDHCDHRPNLEGNRTATNDTPKPLTPARNEPPTNESHRADEAGDRGHRPHLTARHRNIIALHLTEGHTQTIDTLQGNRAAHHWKPPSR